MTSGVGGVEWHAVVGSQKLPSNTKEKIMRRNICRNSFKSVIVVLAVVLATDAAKTQPPVPVPTASIYTRISNPELPTVTLPGDPPSEWTPYVDVGRLVPIERFPRDKIVGRNPNSYTQTSNLPLDYTVVPGYVDTDGKAIDPVDVDRYWDHHKYGDYDKTWDPAVTTGADPSMNCHGYSTEKNIWLEDFTYLMDDDYVYHLLPYNLADGAIAGHSGPVYFIGGGYAYVDHSIKIEKVQLTVVPLGGKITKISEKFRDSGVYEAITNLQFDSVSVVEFSLPSAGFRGYYIKK